MVSVLATWWFAPSSRTMLELGLLYAWESVDTRRAGEDCDDVGVRGCEGVSLRSMLLPFPLGEAPRPGIKIVGCHNSLLKTANPFV